MVQATDPPTQSGTVPIRKSMFVIRFKRDFLLNKGLYLIMLPVLAYYIIFHYGPMYGAIIAFKDYSSAKGITGSEWVGFQNF